MFTESDFFNEYGISLSTALPDDDNPSTKVERFIKRVGRIIEHYVFIRAGRSDTYSDNLSEFQLDHLKVAAMEQALYMIQNEDLFITAGYNSLNNTVTDLSSIVRLAPMALAALSQTGLLYRGVR